MKTIFTLILSFLSIFTLSAQVTTGFDGYSGAGSEPAGWTINNGGSPVYTSATNFGISSPSVRLDNSNESITSPVFSSGTSVTFWIKGQGTGTSNSSVLVEQFDGTTWTTVISLSASDGGIPTTGTNTIPYTLSAGTVRVRFTYTKVTGNLSIDDITVSGGVLPIKLESFTATSRTNTVNLDWKVSSEINISKYEVERSNNGTEFKSISSLTASNSSNYSSVDNSPFSGFNYYRLKIVENDGRFSYSDVQKVKVDGKSLSINAVYPNPASDNITLSINNNSSTEAVIQIIDFNGRTVSTRKVTIQDGLTVKTFNVSDLTSGFYVVRIMTKDETTYEKFVKL